MENLGIFYHHWVFLRPLEIFYGPLVHFVVMWYIFPRFGILDQDKSGNPVCICSQLFENEFHRKGRSAAALNQGDRMSLRKNSPKT
jgi:hypothetical protein